MSHCRTYLHVRQWLMSASGRRLISRSAGLSMRVPPAGRLPGRRRKPPGRAYTGGAQAAYRPPATSHDSAAAEAPISGACPLVSSGGARLTDEQRWLRGWAAGSNYVLAARRARSSIKGG